MAPAASLAWRCAMAGSPNLACTISPCSVMRRLPCTLPGGWLWIARCIGPPPRPMEPPRPWNSVSRTPCALHTATISSWQVYSAQAAARRPASLPESE